MKYINNKIINNQGVVLFITLMIVASILVVSLGAASLVVSGIKMSRTQGYSTRAYFASEAGIERGLWVRRKGEFNFSDCASSGECLDFSVSPVICGDCNLTEQVLGNDSMYNVNYASSTTDMYISFKSVGDYQNTQRSLEIIYTE